MTNFTKRRYLGLQFKQQRIIKRLRGVLKRDAMLAQI